MIKKYTEKDREKNTRKTLIFHFFQKEYFFRTDIS